MTRRKSYQKGSVELHNGQWTVRYREFKHATRSWTLKREVLGEFKNKKSARRAAEPIMARVNERNNNAASGAAVRPDLEMTFKQFVESRWKAYSATVRHEPSTVDNHNSMVKKHLLPFFGDRRMSEIAPGDVTNFLQRLRPRYSDGTVRTIYGMLRTMFEVAAEYDIVSQSPVRAKIHRPRYDRNEKPTLDAGKIGEVIARFPEPLFLLLIAVTGMRSGEAFALCWEDFDSDRSELKVAHTLYRGKRKRPKTESSKRIFKLPREVSDMLIERQSGAQFNAAADFIFCRRDGSPLDHVTVRRQLYRAMDDAKIIRVKGQYGFHIFRHSAASLIYAKMRDLKMVQDTLGHARLSTTSDIYVHLDRQVANEGAQILADEILPNCALAVTQTSEMVS